MSRAFIIICIYNHSIIISVIKRTDEDKDNNPFLRPVFPYHTVHLQMCSTFASSNTLCLTNSKTVSSLVFRFFFFLFFFFVFSSSFYLAFSFLFFSLSLFPLFFSFLACFVLYCWFRFLFSFPLSFFFGGGGGGGIVFFLFFFLLFFFNLSCMQTYDLFHLFYFLPFFIFFSRCDS